MTRIDGEPFGGRGSRRSDGARSSLGVDELRQGASEAEGVSARASVMLAGGAGALEPARRCALGFPLGQPVSRSTMRRDELEATRRVIGGEYEGRRQDEGT